MSATYRAIAVTRPGKFAEVRRPLSDPGSGHVRIRVEACGVCHTKLFQLMLGFLLCAALERMKSPAVSLEDPNSNGLPFKSPQAPAIRPLGFGAYTCNRRQSPSIWLKRSARPAQPLSLLALGLLKEAPELAAGRVE
jgi:hypothetical protein